MYRELPMSDKYAATDVFTPTKPARLTFVERSKINEKLVNALTTPGKQIVVYGHSGSGKTTLLVNKLHQIYEDHITTRCTTGLTFEQIMLEAFDQLEPFYTEERTQLKKKGLSASIASAYMGIKSQLGSNYGTEDSKKEKRLLPPQLTPQMLARLLGEAHCCWVLEDFHKIESNEKTRLSQYPFTGSREKIFLKR
jgi:energy-coupling factor transporter ATP-binding protein EcfA2